MLLGFALCSRCTHYLPCKKNRDGLFELGVCHKTWVMRSIVIVMPYAFIRLLLMAYTFFYGFLSFFFSFAHAIMNIGLRTCVTINFDLFQRFTKHFWLHLCHILAENFYLFVQHRNIRWTCNTRDASKFRLALVIIFEGDFS